MQRRLVQVVLFVVVALAATAPPRAKAFDFTQDKVLYAVGYGHLDDQWNWTIQDSIDAFIPKTLHQNFVYFTNAAFTNFSFSFEGALRYQFIQEYYPADFLLVSNFIAQGRWRLAGSSLTPSDVNIPAPESLIRHTLYANQFWKQTFGRTSTDFLLPDAFGFGYALPSVAAHCGVKGFSSWRVGAGSAIPMPFLNVGRWIGPDGGSMVAVVRPGPYSSTINGNLANDTSRYNSILNIHAETGLYIDYFYFGQGGDQGGGPDFASVSNVCLSANTTNGLINVLSAGSDQLFRDLTLPNIAQLPSYQGELLAQTLGTGGYTAHGELKLYHRQCEQRAAAAEAAAVMADWLQGGGYPLERFNKAWIRFLWHTMYDDLTGVSIPAAYTFTWNDYLLSLSDFAAEETRGIGVVARTLNAAVQGVPLVVYNPLSMGREDLVEATVTFAGGVPAAVKVFDPNGNEVPSQTGTVFGNTLQVIFLANVPSLGTAVYDVRPSAGPSTINTGLTVSSSQLESPRYQVQLNSNGDVTSIFDKISNRQLLSAPIRWAFLYDLSTSLPAWEIQYNNITAAPTSYLAAPASFEVVENGPARVGLAVTRRNAGSTFTERIRLAAGAAGDRVEWEVSANWNTHQTLLKMEFPLTVTNTLATYDLGLGTIRRPNNTANLYEVPAQQWADLSASNNAYGVTLLSDCKYGWDKPANNKLRLTIFHTPAVASSFLHQTNDSIGTHRMLIGLMGHTNDWRACGSAWTAARLNQPLQAFQTTSHAGPANQFSFLTCNNSNVIVRALKKAENSNEIVVRLQELIGQPQNLQLNFAAPILSARQINGVEDSIAPLTVAGGNLSLPIGGNAPLTIAVTLAPPATPVALPLSSPVPLPFNLDAVSTDGNRTNGNFDAGFTYPAELFPSAIVRDGVTFQLGPTNNGAFNALSCNGQTIPLNASGKDQLYLLAASASNITSGTFTINGSNTTLTVPYFTGFIGQWDPPSVLVNQDPAWVCTHRHDGAGNNNSYSFCYLFKFRMPVPPGATSLMLPNAPNIRIFAMTLTTNSVADTFAAGGSLDPNLPPWANAGPNQRLNASGTNGTALVHLDGSASADPDGSIVSYSWSFNGGIIGTGTTATATLPIGTNSVLLTVMDDHGQTGSAETTIIILPPLAVTLTATPTNSPSAPVLVQFTGQASGGTAGSSVDLTDDHTGTISAEGQNNGINGNWEVATNAFDNNPGSKWLDFATNHPTTRSSWIQYRFPAGQMKLVTDYTLTSANDAPERDPANWALLGSNDGGTNWITLDVRTNQTFPGRFVTQSYSLAAPGSYNLYRLRIDRVANPPAAVAVQLAEIQLLGPPSYTYYWSFGDGSKLTSTKAGGPDQQPHTYTNTGTYTVTLGATYGAFTGTNSLKITVGPPLAVAVSATPSNGAAPLTIQFNAQVSGGRTNQGSFDTTDNHLGFISAQGENGGLNGNNEVAANAFDNVTGTKWLDFAVNYPSTRQSWIQHQYPDGLRFAVFRYTVTSANDATIYPARNPANWRFQASNDEGASWTTLDVRTNQTFTTNFQKFAYVTTNNAGYNLYRFQIDRVANPSQAEAVQLDELEFIANVPSYWWRFGDGGSSSIKNPQHTFSNNGVYVVTVVVSDGLSAVTNQFPITIGPPELTIGQPSSGSVPINWPAWASAYSLYATTNLNPGVIWEPVTNNVTLVGDHFTVSIPIQPSGTRFFQLRLP